MLTVVFLRKDRKPRQRNFKAEPQPDSLALRVKGKQEVSS